MDQERSNPCMDSLDQPRSAFRFLQEGIGFCLLSVETVALTLPFLEARVFVFLEQSQVLGRAC